LKTDQIARARRSGATAVVPIVHWDNDPMIELNVSLGAQTSSGSPVIPTTACA
jgi:hypothetical protein